MRDRAEDQDIAEIAEHYVARLYSGDMSAKEEADLSSWLEADQRHKTALDKALEVWDSLEWMTDEAKIVSLRLEAQSRNKKLRGRRGVGLLAATAAVVAIGVAVLLSQNDVPDAHTPVSYETVTGGSQSVVLADGSTMQLNTASRVIVDYSDEERRIILDVGEIYLDVETDPDRPMSVLAGDRIVTALGTKFSVKREGLKLQVAVAEGRVAVRRQGSLPPIPSAPVNKEHIVLNAGSVAEISGNDDTRSISSATAVMDAQAWRDGVVRFSAEPLIDVIGEFNRYSKAKVLIEDKSIMDCPIGGVLHLDNLELFLSSLEVICPVRVVHHPDRYVLVANPAKK